MLTGIGGLIAAAMLAGCSFQPSEQVAMVQPSSTPHPPAIPSHPPLTPTPSLTPTPTPVLSPTPTWTLTPTETPTPFPVVALILPSATPLPTETEEQVAVEATPVSDTATVVTATPEPTAIPASSLPAPYSVHLTEVNLTYLRAVYEHGQRLGRDRTRFTKIGDCHSTSRVFLQPIDRGRYALGEYAYLENAVTHFAGSFEHIGEAAFDGMHMDSLLDPIWSDPDLCDDGESRIICEFRLWNASIALIFVQPTLTSSDTWRELFYSSLRNGIETSISNGVIPVLATQFDWEGHPVITEDTNRIIKQVGAEYQVPVWDFYASTFDLPRHGDRGNWHLTTSPYSSTDFSDPRNLQYAMTIRNLEALQVLHFLLYEVMY